MQTLLRYVPEEHLTGLHRITLTNSEYTRKWKGKLIQEKKRFRPADCRGMYWQGQIWLNVDQIGESELLMIIPTSRTLLIGYVLFHELGHHIHRMEEPGFRKDREDFADEWKDKLMGEFLRQRYWYLSGVLKLLAPVLRPIYARLRRQFAEEEV